MRMCLTLYILCREDDTDGGEWEVTPFGAWRKICRTGTWEWRNEGDTQVLLSVWAGLNIVSVPRFDVASRRHGSALVMPNRRPSTTAPFEHSTDASLHHFLRRASSSPSSSKLLLYKPRTRLKRNPRTTILLTRTPPLRHLPSIKVLPQILRRTPTPRRQQRTMPIRLLHQNPRPPMSLRQILSIRQRRRVIIPG